MLTPVNGQYSRMISERQRLSECYHELSYSTKRNLNLLFKALIEGEQSYESARSTFVNQALFSSYQNFCLVRRYGEINFNKDDLNAFLKANSVFLNASELDCVFDRLDANKDGNVDAAEFQSL